MFGNPVRAMGDGVRADALSSRLNRRSLVDGMALGNDSLRFVEKVINERGSVCRNLRQRVADRDVDRRGECPQRMPGKRSKAL